jgi:hypothetical protein
VEADSADVARFMVKCPQRWLEERDDGKGTGWSSWRLVTWSVSTAPRSRCSRMRRWRQPMVEHG